MNAAQRSTRHPVPYVEGERREGDCARLVSGSEKAVRELGWTPERSTLEQMIADAWRWHRDGGYER